MLQRRIIGHLTDPYWNRLTSFSVVLFFILLADAFLSYWVPNFLQDSLGSSFKMGLVMGFSSLVGFGADLIFPQILKNASVTKLILSAIVLSFLFIFALYVGLLSPVIAVFLLAMAIWGIYYEYLHFAQSQFVADLSSLKLRATSWGIIGMFRNMAYFLGPLIAGTFLMMGENIFLGSVAIFLAIGLSIFIFGMHLHERPITINPTKVNILSELSHWKLLIKSVWPIVLLSLTMGLIDATFWTTGAVWTENASQENFWGTFILPAYQLPSLFVGLLIAKWNIYLGKKKIAERFLALTGLALCLLIFYVPYFVVVSIVFVASCFLAISYPLVEAVYSDITARMGMERKHLIGLSASTISLAYIIGPVLAGFISSLVGDRHTFVIIGFVTLVVSTILLLVTPKKIHLPQTKIASWSD